jgi:hypothetical protein
MRRRPAIEKDLVSECTQFSGGWRDSLRHSFAMFGQAMFLQTDWRKVVTDIRAFARAGRAAIISTMSGDADLHF